MAGFSRSNDGAMARRAASTSTGSESEPASRSSASASSSGTRSARLSRQIEDGDFGFGLDDAQFGKVEQHRSESKSQRQRT